MAVQPGRKVTYDDYVRFPDDGRRREVIDGEAYVVASPNTRHQRIVGRLHRLIADHLERHEGGEVFASPYDVLFSETDFVQPDVVFVSDQDAHVITEANIKGSPTWVVEVVSDPRRDRTQKRSLYERYRVPEYWIVDPDEDRLEVYRLGERGYAAPQIFEPGQVVSPLRPRGLEIDLAGLLRR